MKLLITCFQGTAVALANELKILGCQIFDNFSSGMYVNGKMEDVYKINLNSRIANKVYLEVGEKIVKNFDQLFEFVQNIDRKKFIRKGHKVSISTNIFQSQINSNKSTQSIVNKAILKKLTGGDGHWLSDPQKEPISILVQIINDKCSIFVNTSGESLHNRGYRKETGEAPLKENLAASLIRMCGRHFKTPLLDPMCGSGTICIEAAMIAKNIAPGLQRNFAFETFEDFDQNKFDEIKKELESKIFEGKYQITGYDIDPKILELAKNNAKRAGVLDTITFEQRNIKDLERQNDYIVCNPPYGKRLKDDNIKSLYENLIRIYGKNSKGCFISSSEFADRMVGYDFKIKNLNNNDEMVKLYIKK